MFIAVNMNHATVIQIVSCLAISMTLWTNSGVSTTNVTFGGECELNKTGCKDCYIVLKESLLKRDGNVRNLSEKFFPPRANLPEFVEVTYHFDDDINKKEVWYWTHESSYLFFPMETFQFLFFGKPATFFSQKVNLTLDAECSEANYDMMRLLTQRLKDFIQGASFDPTIDDNYFARSQENNYSKDDNIIIENETAVYLAILFIVGTIIISIILAMLLLIYFNTKRWDKRLIRLNRINKPNKYIQSKIFSIAIIALIINVYTICLDGLAFREVKTRKSDVDRPVILSDLTYVMFAINMLTILWWMVSCLIIVCCNTKLYLLLAISTVGPTIGLMIHLPYILIAYLNDAAYATSIFIYYTIIVFVLFGTLDLSFGTCIGALINKQNNEENNRFPFCTTCSRTEIIVAFAIIIPVSTILIILLVGMIAAAIIVIPISGPISDAPNRLLGFYQTVFILGGAYLVYRSFFKKTPTIESVVKDQEEGIFGINDDRNERWRGLSSDEKVAEFYSHIMKIVGKMDSNDRAPVAGLNPVQPAANSHRAVVQENNVDPDDQVPVARLNPEQPEAERCGQVMQFNNVNELQHVDMHRYQQAV